MANRYNEYKLEYSVIIPCNCGCCSDVQHEEDYFDSEEKALEAFEIHDDHFPKLYKLNEQGWYEPCKGG